MSAGLFKKAPETFRRRAMTIVNLILTGHYEYKPADLEARVILICKDASNPELGSLATSDRSPSATPSISSLTS